MAPEVIATRLVDAQVIAAGTQWQPSLAAADGTAQLAPTSWGQVAWRIRQAWGSRWMPGRATLTAATLQFEALPPVRLLLGEDASLELDLRGITHLDTRSLPLGGEITATVPGAVVRFRCRGADRCAGQVRDAVRAARRR